MICLNGFRTALPSDIPSGNVIACIYDATGTMAFGIRVEDGSGQAAVLGIGRWSPQQARPFLNFGYLAKRCVDLGAKPICLWRVDENRISPGNFQERVEHGTIVIAADKVLVAAAVPAPLPDIRFWDIATGKMASDVIIGDTFLVREWTLAVSGVDGEHIVIAKFGVEVESQ